MRRKLSDKDIRTAKKVGFIKMARVFKKAYNKLCPMCKVKVVKDPRRSINDYCPKCKAMLEPMLEGLVK